MVNCASSRPPSLRGRLNWRALAAFIACAFVACSDASGPSRLSAGVHVLSGSGASDTVTTILHQPLVVEVVDSTGAGVANHTITFSAVTGQLSYPGLVAFSATNQPVAAGFRVTLTTDRTGRAEVYVQMGWRAGPAAIAVSAQNVGPADTARFTVRPGAPVGVAAIPADTAVYPAHTFTLRGAVVDHFGNAISQSGQYQTLTPEIAIAGQQLTGVTIGRGAYLVSATVNGTLKTDTGRVSVVPQGVVAATDLAHIYVFNTDGSGFRVLLTRINSDPRWSPSGAEIAFDESLIDQTTDGDGGGPDSLIHAVDTAGNVRTITAPTIGGVHQGPQYSRDGQWIYFARYPGNFVGNPRGSPTLWRVHPDGSGAGPVPVAVAGSYGFPTPSPDGSQLAFQTVSQSGSAVDWGGTLMSLTVSTGALSSLAVPGEEPVWSPTGNMIAYVKDLGQGDDQGPIVVMASDGTTQRQIGSASYNPRLDWSPDGTWIIAERATIEIVNVQTGLRLPLAFTQGLTSPTWRP